MTLSHLLRSLTLLPGTIGAVHFFRMIRAHAGHHPVVWVSLSGGGAGSAADLRAIALCPALERLGWRCVKLHPRLGLTTRQFLLRLFSPAVVLLQQTRHPLNQPDIYGQVPCVLDVDDADIINPAEAERIGGIAARCHGVVTGSSHLARLFEKHNHAVRVIWTGTYIHSVPGAQPNAARGAVLAWAPSDPFGYPVELAFVLALVECLPATRRVEFRVYGVPPRRHADMLKLWEGRMGRHVQLRLMFPMPYKAFVSSLAEVAVGLQPVCKDHAYSLGKSFGKALAYLAADVAVVASNNVDHPLFFRDCVNARLMLNSPGAWARACDELLADSHMREDLVQQARKAFLTRLTTNKSAELMSDLLHRARLRQAWPQGLAKKGE